MLKTLSDFPIEVQNIRTGSATPGCDLMSAVRRGLITKADADGILNFDNTGFDKYMTAEEHEAYEIQFMRDYDI